MRLLVVEDDAQVAAYLVKGLNEQGHTVDHAAGVQDKTEEERREAGNGNVVAACIGSETARVCLETGRWNSYNIYYPKGDDNMQGWVDSTAQAAADLIEQRFWS